MKRILIFPTPFRIKNPTVDEQNAYLFSSLMDEAEIITGGYGHFVEVNTLEEAVYDKEIRKIIAEQRPDWIITFGESATACINLHWEKKILINPTVTSNDLNNVPEYARQHTYGFFSALSQQEESYELFQKIYPNAVWYLNVSDLHFIDIKEIATGIINGNLSA